MPNECFFYCNIRGIGNSDTRVALKNLFLSHKPVLIFVAELMGPIWLTALRP